jgi:ABC-type transport system substrate-binding protein
MQRPLARLVALALILGAASLTGCRGRQTLSSGGGAQPAAGRVAGGATAAKVLTLAWEDDIDSLDPAKAYIVPSWDTNRNIFDALLDYDEKTLDLRPNVAEAWEVSDDGLVYTFRLKADQKFSDGTPLTAEDFRYSWTRILNPTTASPGAGFFNGIVGAKAFSEGKADAVSGLEAPDAQTLRVTLEKPDRAFPYIVAMNFAFPVPRHVVENPEWDYPRKPVGNGRFYLEQWKPSELIVLKRNQNYAAGEPAKVDEIRYILGQQSPQLVQRFEAGEIDILQQIPSGEFAHIQADPRYAQCMVSMPQGAIRYLCMNVEMAPFDKLKVRQAVGHAVNRQNLIKLLNNRAVEAIGILPPTLREHNPALQPLDYDPAKARQLLAEAGLPNGFSTDLFYYQEEDRQRLAEAIQEDLQSVGIKAVLRPTPRSAFQDQAGQPGKVPFAIGEWYQDYPDPSNYLDVLLHSREVRDQSSNNYARYRNPRLDALIDAARHENDATKRTDLYRQAEEIALADVPWVPLHHQVAYIVHQPNVTGVSLHPVTWIRLELVDKK